MIKALAQIQYQEFVAKILKENRTFIKDKWHGHHILPKEFYPQWWHCEWNRLHLTDNEHNYAHDLLRIIYAEEYLNIEAIKAKNKKLIQAARKIERKEKNHLKKLRKQAANNIICGFKVVNNEAVFYTADEIYNLSYPAIGETK